MSLLMRWMAEQDGRGPAILYSTLGPKCDAMQYMEYEARGLQFSELKALAKGLQSELMIQRSSTNHFFCPIRESVSLLNMQITTASHLILFYLDYHVLTCIYISELFSLCHP